MIDFYLLPPNTSTLAARQEKGGSKTSIVSRLIYWGNNLQLLISVGMNDTFGEYENVNSITIQKQDE